MVGFSTIAIGGVAGVLTLVGYRRYKESRKRLPADSHVVIVGAGYAGLSLADKIDGKGKYTIIDAKDSLHHNMASLRASVEPGFAVKTFIPYQPKFGDNFRQGRVTGIDTERKLVSLAGDDSPIPYTHLVIATGSSGPFPGKCDFNTPVPKLIEKYEDYAQTILNAKKIVVIGGGAVGVELAAEIAKEYPEKAVTVVHNGETLVTNKLAPKALEMIEKRLNEMKVNVIMGDTVENMQDLPLNELRQNMVVKTVNGRQLEADLVIPCVGLRVNSEAYAESMPDKVNKRGQLIVDETMQVKGLENVYAIGDCNDLPVGKLAMESAFQAFHLWDNLSSESEPKPYQGGTFRMTVPLGRDGGVAQNGTWVLGDWAARRIKAKDVFVTFAWKTMGQPVPKSTIKDS